MWSQHQPCTKRIGRWAAIVLEKDRDAGPPQQCHAPASACRLRSISRQIIGVKMSCMASGIFAPGQTMVFGRDMNESGSIDSR